MKKLHRYILSSFIGPFVMIFFICVFVLLMQFLWNTIDDMVGKGLEWTVIGELLFYAAVGLTPMAFPLAMLLASIMTFGNLGESYELVAMKASGISLLRIMKPLILVAVGLTCFAFYSSNTILPEVNLKLTSLMRGVKNQKPEMAIAEGVFTNEIDGYSIKVTKKDNKTGMLYGLLIYDHTERQGNISITLADSGSMAISTDRKSVVMTLYSGESADEQDYRTNKRTRRYKYHRTKFSKRVLNVPVKGFEFEEVDGDRYRNDFRMQNIKTLTHYEDSLYTEYNNKIRRLAIELRYNMPLQKAIADISFRNDSIPPKYDPFICEGEVSVDSLFASLPNDKQTMAIQAALREAERNKQRIGQNQNDIISSKKLINRYPMEIHRKYTWSMACLIFFFVGAPLGAIIRKGGLGLPTIVSILLFIVYYIISISGERFAREDVWSIATGMWFGCAVFLPFGIYLTYQAMTESDSLSIDAQFDWFKKIMHKIIRKKDKTQDKNL